MTTCGQPLLLFFGTLCFVVRLGNADEYHPQDVSAPSGRRGRDTLPPIDWNQRARASLKKVLDTERKVRKAKNVILFIGDGMGVSTLTAARVMLAQNITGQRVEDSRLSWDHFPNTGMIQTYNTDFLTPDSAATATAFLCGEKTRSCVVGVNQAVPNGDCASQAGNELNSLIHNAITLGYHTGIVTTARITHATPAAAYAHAANRDWENDALTPSGCIDIAKQLILDDKNQQIKVILGGGRREFRNASESDPEYPEEKTKGGKRHDGRDLIKEWKTLHGPRGKYVDKRREFEAATPDKTDFLFGLFEDSHMKFETERLLENPSDEWTEPSLTEMTKKAIDILKKSENGYFLLVESGKIDHAHHANVPYMALRDTVELSNAVQLAVNETDEDDTLLVVTADHSHVFTINGYQDIRNSLFSLARKPDGSLMLGQDGKPYQTLGYINGPGFNTHRRQNGTNDEIPRINLLPLEESGELFKPDFVHDSGIPWTSESHGGEDVAVYARGPMSHLFVGQHEQSYIAHAIMYAGCLGPYSNTAAFCQTTRSTTPAGTGGAVRGEALGFTSALLLLIATYTELMM